MTNLKVGIAEIDYTPQIGLPLMGNYRNDYASRGIHDPLYARAIVFYLTSNPKVAMLTMDVNKLTRDNVSLMRKFIADNCDITPENIFISATHTHAGPATAQTGLLPKTDDATLEAFLEKAATAVTQANDNLTESTLSLGYAYEDRISFIRRLKCKDGKTHMNWEELDGDFVIEPLGSIDPQVITLSIQQQEKLNGAIVNFALHPAVLAGGNWLYSADYPGYLAEALGRLMGVDFITAFFLGCCGNVNHLDYSDPLQGRGYTMTQRIGYMLAVSAYEALQQQTFLHVNKIAASREMVKLARKKITEQQRQWCLEILEKAKNHSAPRQPDGLPDEQYAQLWLDMYQNQNSDDTAEVMVIRLGELAIVGMPGDTFSQFGMTIKEKSPTDHTIVIQYANDAIGYIPTREAFEQGGYEPTPGSTMYEKDIGERLTASALSQLNRLFKQ